MLRIFEKILTHKIDRNTTPKLLQDYGPIGSAITSPQQAWGITGNFIIWAVFILITGCGVSHGVYHTVERGQTLWRIAKTYGVDHQELAEVNDITDPTQVKVGQKIFIPGASRVLE
ncbi:MAG: LysM peptidoglycan-binding domain-containing protein, partial [Deltaproteobacteria bacterium]|nr:LysM peptidoglycan-binding domain-containing protein [Deltaproteobacteria bacterium]